MAQKKKVAEHFKLEFPGDTVVKDMIRDKMADVRSNMMRHLQKPVSNTEILNNALDA